MNARLATVAISLAFGVWEATDILDTGVVAGVFSVLFLVSALCLYRRSSRWSAVLIGLLCTVEASQAHTWKDASTFAKDAAMFLGSAGIVAALAFLVLAISPKGATQ
ncbi:MAG TPA: hypothetical protein VGU02_08905 [Gaiellaceae bacterium]|nr:hypothetical protein [Gaiellaceae bacterium]